MKKTTCKPHEMQNLTAFLQRLKAMIREFELWYERLDERTKQQLLKLHDSAFDHLDEARSDITAMTSEYLVCIAAALIEKEKEERK